MLLYGVILFFPNFSTYYFALSGLVYCLGFNNPGLRPWLPKKAKQPQALKGRANMER